jgi:predicted DNA-binding transcriptional regulator YafY
MTTIDRLQQLHRLLKSHRRPVPLAKLAERMECSEKTARRAIEDMRNFFDAPIDYFTDGNGWQYTESQTQFELPGLWLTSRELQSLTLLLHVLENFGNGLLNQELTTFDKEIQRLLKARNIDHSAFVEHIKVLPLASRYVPGKIFQQVGEALLQRRCLEIRYKSFDQRQSVRVISPQTLVYYRENWYLDAWCHLRNALRTFSLARIVAAISQNEAAKRISSEQLHEHFSKSYGIFAGKAENIAKLRFFAEIAREISMQQWHPEQIGAWDGDNYLLSFPYSDARELIGDIMRHAPNVYVEAPVKLRKAVQERFRLSLELFSGQRIRRS